MALTEVQSSTGTKPPPVRGGEPAAAGTPRQFAAALLIGVAGIVLVNLAVRHTELVTGRAVSGGVPPVAAFTSLVLLLAARPVLRRYFRIDLSREQLLVVFTMVALGTFLTGQYAVRAFLPHLVSVQYWSRTRGDLTPFAEFVPKWFAPTDPVAVRHYFEGNHGQGVPWGQWIGPLTFWLLFWVAMFGAGWCVLLLFRRPWIHHERLSFPLLTLPLALTERSSRFGSRPLLRNPVLWCGIGAAAFFDGLNIAHTLWPSIPAPGFYFPLTGMFTERTHEPLNSIWLFFMPEGIGFGYFLPLEVSFSTWFFYLAGKAFAVGALSAGWEQPGLPFYQEQSAGAILTVAVMLLAGSAGFLARLFRGAFLKPWRRMDPEEREARLAWTGLALCSAFLLWFCVTAGMAVRVAAFYLAVLAAFMLVYARLRAETGAPYEFVYPYGMPKQVVVQALSVQGILDVGGARTMAMFAAFAWLSRHHPGHMTAAIGADSLKLAEVTGSTRGRFFVALALALAFGYAAACWSHLSAYYDLGSNLAGGGNGQGEWRAQVAYQEFQRALQQTNTPPPRDEIRIGFMGAGAGMALGLSLLRRAWLSCPFHPLGFILGTAYGDSTIFFLSLFIAWLVKWSLLRAGGLRLYREGLPFFIGLIVGHFTVAGIVWPVISLFIGRDAAAAYQVYFG